MKHMMHIALALIVLACGAVPGGAAEPAKHPLDGTWEMVSLERDGEQLKVPEGMRLVATGNSFEVKMGDKLVAAGTTVADHTKKPIEVDVTYTEGPDKGKTLKGICEIEGDTVKFCRAGAPEQERPTEFKTKAGTGALFSVYKRVDP